MTFVHTQYLPYDLAARYDRLAPCYDRLHRRWLASAGAEAQVALEASVRALMTPETSLLDAGCGTGKFARSLISEGISPSRLTLLDPSNAMLSRCADIPAMKIKGRLENLPFGDEQFDVVACAWALETVPDLQQSLAELMRVIRPAGALVLAFCADKRSQRPVDWAMRQMVQYRGTGRFLSSHLVVRIIEETGAFVARSLAVRGPASAVIARRGAR